MRDILKYIQHPKIKNAFSIILFICGLLGIFLEIIRSVSSQNFFESILLTSLYFTTQSNFLFTLFALFLLLKFEDKKWFKYFAFIAFMNMFITGSIFHILLVGYVDHVGFIQHLLHTINPILFIVFYFFFYQQKLTISRFWIVLIYPLFYMLTVYLIIEPLLGNMLSNLLPNFYSARYVYPFLDPRVYDHGVLGLIGFTTGILAPIMMLISLLIIWIKAKVDQEILYKIAKKKLKI